MHIKPPFKKWFIPSKDKIGKITLSRRYRFCLHKAFFDTGNGIISSFKIQYSIIGLFLVNFYYGILGITIFAISSYILGRLWYFYMQIYSAEVGNQYNLFQKQIREKLIKPQYK